MLHAIGEAAMQHTVRTNYDSEMHNQDLVIKKSDQVQKKRPVEKTEDSQKAFPDFIIIWKNAFCHAINKAFMTVY